MNIAVTVKAFCCDLLISVLLVKVKDIISSARVITQDINYYPHNVYVFSFITRISNQYRNIIGA